MIYAHHDRNIRQYRNELKTNWRNTLFLGTIRRWMPWGWCLLHVVAIEDAPKDERYRPVSFLVALQPPCYLIHFLTAGCCWCTRVRSYRVLGILTIGVVCKVRCRRAKEGSKGLRSKQHIVAQVLLGDTRCGRTRLIRNKTIVL